VYGKDSFFSGSIFVCCGFTDRYNVTRLVYFEETSSVEAAIAREKQLKNWRRAWKLELIEKEDPEWRDLADDF
jgi:putative endonuclease